MAGLQGGGALGYGADCLEEAADARRQIQGRGAMATGDSRRMVRLAPA
mgnify:CR=1 FL=1